MLINILSVDENDMVSELDRVAYKKTGFHVIPAAGFADVEQIVSRKSIDVIAINLDIKKYDPIALVQYLKNNPHTKEIPLVAASVQTGAIRKKALAAGVDLFIEQPIPRHYYIEKIKKLLAQATRTTDRLEYSLTTSMLIDGQNSEAQVMDISPSGIMVGIKSDVGQVYEMRLSLPGYKRQLSLKAEVVRIIPKTADDNADKVAMKFTEISDDNKRRIEKFVLTHQNEGELRFYL